MPLLRINTSTRWQNQQISPSYTDCFMTQRRPRSKTLSDWPLVEYSSSIWDPYSQTWSTQSRWCTKELHVLLPGTTNYRSDASMTKMINTLELGLSSIKKNCQEPHHPPTPDCCTTPDCWKYITQVLLPQTKPKLSSGVEVPERDLISFIGYIKLINGLIGNRVIFCCVWRFLYVRAYTTINILKSSKTFMWGGKIMRE